MKILAQTLLVACGVTIANSYNLSEVLEKSILFYEAQRSGKLPANNRVPWRGDSALNDSGANGEDLVGGWYDAGDHVKFGLPMAFSTVALTWGLLKYEDAYRASGQYGYMLDCIKWPLDYFIKAHTSKFEFYGQVGNTGTDHSYWGRPEDMTMSRPAYRITASAPGSDLAAVTSSAMAAGYLAFKNINSSYAAILLQHAIDLYEFAETYKGDYVKAIPDAANAYYTNGYSDELAWGAVWLYLASGQQSYLTKASTTYYDSNTPGFGVGSMHAGYKVLLYEISNRTVTQYSNEIFWYLGYWLGGGFPFSPKGLLVAADWGSIRLAANQAFIALLAADLGISVDTHREFAKRQINYTLGDGGRSFVVGYGLNPPTHPHHRAASCPSPPAICSWSSYDDPSPNPHVIVGAVVGGPNASDAYNDVRQDYVHNEVATDYNACFQSAVAALLHLQLESQVTTGIAPATVAPTTTTTKAATTTTKAAATTTKAAATTTKAASTTTKAAATTTKAAATTPKAATTMTVAMTATVVATTASPSATTLRPATLPGGGVYNLSEVISKSILFYEAQRSGKLPPNNRVPWRGDSALNDKGIGGEDLTGGWYDAGDHVKFGLPMAFSAVALTWGLLKYEDAYRASGQYGYMLDCVKWPLDYFIKAHTSKFEFYGQVGNTGTDHTYWGRPEDMTMSRPAYRITASTPGSDLAALTASALAAGHLAFKAADSSYAAILLQHAVDLYEFAETYKGDYIDAIPDAAGSYYARGYNDELAWGAAWLYLATGQQSYLTKASTTYYDNNTPGFAVGSMHAGYKILLYEISNKTNAQYSNEVFWYLSYWLGGGFPFSPKGLLVASDWGSIRYAANQALIAIMAADLGISVNGFRDFAKKQINYALGDGGRSFVVGYGNNPPTHSHHRAASCPSPPTVCLWTNYEDPAPNPHVLIGALVGGPNATDYFYDSRQDYVRNEVATDYNACFQSTVAAMLHLQLTNQY